MLLLGICGRLIVKCSETRPNAKPETVIANGRTTELYFNIEQTMTKIRGLILITFLFTTDVTYGQGGRSSKLAMDTLNMTFKDTVFNFAFDSIAHNLGNIVPTNENNRLVKYFKYIGKEPIVITRAWTGDPHFICEYPQEPLIPNKIYSFTICFWHQDRQGKMAKVMGFDLSDGNRISFMFTGTYLPITKQDK